MRCAGVAAWNVGAVAVGGGQNGGCVELAGEEHGPQDGNAGNSCEQNPLATYFCPRCYISGDKMCRRRLFGMRLARFSSGSHHKVTIVTVTPLTRLFHILS